MKFFLIILLLVSLSCKNQKTLMLTNNDQDNQLTLLVQDGYFFTDTMETNVIRDEKNLKSFYSKVNRTRKPGLPIPQIDFEKEMVLVVCMGEQKTTGMPSLRILQEQKQETIIGVEMGDSTIKNSTNTSYPFCVYKMPISENEVLFKQL